MGIPNNPSAASPLVLRHTHLSFWSSPVSERLVTISQAVRRNQESGLDWRMTSGVWTTLHQRRLWWAAVVAVNLLTLTSTNLNPLALRAANTGLTILLIFSSQKRFYQKYLKEKCLSEYSNILWEFALFPSYFQKYENSRRYFPGNSECEWVKAAWQFWWSHAGKSIFGDFLIEKCLSENYEEVQIFLRSYCKKYHRSRRKILEELLSINGLIDCMTPAAERNLFVISLWEIEPEERGYIPEVLRGETNELPREYMRHSFQGSICIQATLLNPDWCGPLVSVRIRQNPDYAYRKYTYRKALGPSNLSGLYENPDYRCPD